MAVFEFNCIDAHTCGNPVRVVTTGLPLLEGATMREKRLFFMEQFDWIRRGLMFEPRGHDQMSGSMLFPPHDPENDAAVLFIETSGCLPMCGHGTIGTVTVAIQEKLIQPKTPGLLRLETPAGLVIAEYIENDNRVESVRIRNVPSFLAMKDVAVHCDGLEALKADIAFGGNFYAIIDVQPGFSGLEHFDSYQLIQWARQIRDAFNLHNELVHPEDSTIRGLSHVLWTGAPIHPGSTARNAVVYGNKAIDRSPCGTGTSARMAQWYSKGKLSKGEPFIHESIIGSKFTGRIEEEITITGIPAIIPSIEGWARVTGYNKIIIDEKDPFAFGFEV